MSKHQGLAEKKEKERLIEIKCGREINNESVAETHTETERERE